MGMIRKILGPVSKYDKTLPYSYMAREEALEGEEDLYNYYFADTICGLVDYLARHDIGPDTVDLFGLYQQDEVPLDTTYCVSPEGQWLTRPEICKSLEDHYNQTLQEKYKGHHESTPCSFDDRERQGSGPF